MRLKLKPGVLLLVVALSAPAFALPPLPPMPAKDTIVETTTK